MKIRSKLRHGTFGVHVAPEDLPQGFSTQASDFLNRLLEIEPKNRLGFQGNVDEVKNHPWLADFTWDELASKAMPAPYIPLQQ